MNKKIFIFLVLGLIFFLPLAVEASESLPIPEFASQPSLLNPSPLGPIVNNADFSQGLASWEVETPVSYEDMRAGVSIETQYDGSIKIGLASTPSKNCSVNISQKTIREVKKGEILRFTLAQRPRPNTIPGNLQIFFAGQKIIELPEGETQAYVKDWPADKDYPKGVLLMLSAFAEAMGPGAIGLNMNLGGGTYWWGEIQAGAGSGSEQSALLPAQATPSPLSSQPQLLPGEKIAFTRDTIKPEPLAGATPELWLLTEDGEKIITDDKNDNVRDFVISPDGERLFYVLDHGWTTGGDFLPWEKDLFLYDIAKNEKKKLEIVKRPSGLAFSPDGQKISFQDEIITKISKDEYDKRMEEATAFEVGNNEYVKITKDFWIADKDGGNPKMIRPNEEESVAGQLWGQKNIWSPDSSKIGFYGKLNRMDNCWNSLWVYDLNKGESKKVKDDEVRNFTFSPDSSKIVLATRAGAEIIDLSGNKIVDLAAEKTKSTDKIFWFTDKIIFQGDVGCNNTIQPQTLWQVKPDGGNLEKLYEASSPDQIFYFVASANGEKILLMDSKKGAGLKILETKTKKIQDLGKGERPSDFWGSWGVGNSQTADFLIFQDNPSLSLEEEATYNPWNLSKLNSETFNLEPLAKDLEGTSVAWYVPKEKAVPTPTPAPSQSSLSKLKQYLSGFFQGIYDKTIGRIRSLLPGEEKIKISPGEEDKILEGSVAPVDFMKNWQITNVTYFKGNIFRGERTDWYIMLGTKNSQYTLPIGKKAFVLFELYDKKDTAKGWLNTLGGPGEVIEKVDVGSSEKIPNQTVIKVPDVILFPAFWPDEGKVVVQFYVEGKGNVSLDFTRDINIEENPNVKADCAYGMVDAIIDLSAASGNPLGKALKESKKEINYAKAINECNQKLPSNPEAEGFYEAMGRHTACCFFEYAAKESPLKYFKAACTYAQRAIACKTVFTEYLPDYWGGVSADLMAKGVPINAIVLGSPAEVVVNSETQKKIGIAEGKVVNDFGDAGLVVEGYPTVVAFEEVMPFSVNVKGLEEGTFDLSLIQAKPEGKIARFDYKKVPISPDKIAVLAVKPSGDPQKDFPLILPDNSQKQPDKFELLKPTSKPVGQESKAKLTSTLILGLAIFLLATIAVVLLIVFKRNKRKKIVSRFCQNCGMKTSNKAEFCTGCGKKLKKGGE